MNKIIDVQKLKEQIVLPDWEKRLLPLFLFKGTKPYRIKALWGYAYAMYLGELEGYGVGAWRAIEQEQNGLGHLCGLHAQPQAMWGFFQRLRGSQQLTDSVDKGFTEYVEWLMPGQCALQRVPYIYNPASGGTVGWWRKAPPKKTKIWREPKQITGYPFVQSAQAKTPEQQLLLDVHAQIPRGVDPSIRGDLCQDLIVAVLSGDITVANIPNVLHRYKTVARKMLPHARSVSWEGEQENRPSFDDSICADHEHA